MTRFLAWAARLIPPRGGSAGGVLPGALLDGQVFLVWLVKLVPSRVGGYLTWVWVWGFTYPDYRGTLLGVRSWYRTLSWGPPRWGSLKEAPPRRVPRLGPPSPVGAPLEDLEWYTLDNVFSPGVELFQDSLLDRFEVQQDYDPEQGEDFTPPEDLLLGTPEGISREEPDNLLFRGRFSRLKKKTRRSPREGEPLEFFHRGGRRGLSRVVDPGDGPSEDDHEDLDEVMSPGGEPLWDWYLQRGSPLEITQGGYPGGYFRYLHLQHLRTWRGDPAGDPAGWSTRADGLIPWLFRTKSRRLTSRVDRYRRWRRRNFFRWIRKPSRRLGPHGPRRRLRFRRLRFWTRATNFLERYQRWTPPAPQEVHFDTEKTKYDRFENSRFTRWGLSHRGRRLRWRLTRVAPPVGFPRRGHPRRTHGGPHRGRWLTQWGTLPGAPRGRYLPWSRPGWLSRGAPRVTPPGYFLVGVAGGVALLILFFPLLEGWAYGGVRGPGWGIRPPTGGFRPHSWASPTEGAPLGGEYLGTPGGVPRWWETFRDWTPRGVRSTDPGFYLGWSDQWATRLMILPTVGVDWTDTPGIGGNLFVRDFFRRILPYWAGWESYSILPDHTWGVLSGVVAHDPRGETYYQEYWGPRLPSYAHFDYKINDSGVGINYMEMWRDRVPWYLPPGESKWTLPPVPDDISERRFLDFYYGDYGGMNLHWATIVEYDHPELPDWVGWVYTEAVPYSLSPTYFERTVHAEVRLPEWGSRSSVWEDLTREVAWVDPGVFWFAGPYHLGMNDHFVWSDTRFPRTEGYLHLFGVSPWSTPGGSAWLNPATSAGATEVTPPPGGWITLLRGWAYVGGLLVWGGRFWSTPGGFVRVIPTRRRTSPWLGWGKFSPRRAPGVPRRDSQLNFLTLWTPRPRGVPPSLVRSSGEVFPTRRGRSFPSRGVPRRGPPSKGFHYWGGPLSGVIFSTPREELLPTRLSLPPGMFGGRFRTRWEKLKLLPEELPRWRFPGVSRGWGFPGVAPPGRPGGATWRVPSGGVTRAVHGVVRGGHLRATLGGYTPVGATGAPPGGPGYSVGWYHDDYDDAFESHQGDDEFGGLFDFTGPLEENHQLRYLSVGSLTGVPTGLTGFKRYHLPGGPAGGGYFSGGTTLVVPGVSPPGGYLTPRGGRRLTRENLLEGFPGEPPGLFLSGGGPDELDLLPLLTPPGGGYRFGVRPSRGVGLFRRGVLRGATRGVWSAPPGGPGGETLGTPVGTPGEVFLLGALTGGFLEGYHLERLETELSFFIDRDSEDYLSDGEPHEELHEEIPRSRAREFPPWVVDLALSGVSPGTPPTGGVPEFTLPGGRAGRGRLRRYYRAWRNKLTRRTRRPTLRGGSRWPAGENNISLPQEAPRWVPGPGFGGALVRAELDTLTTPVDYELETDEVGDESLRLWALTEVYLGDYPVGSHLDS